MSYRYLDIKSNIFTEKGQVMFLSIRDNINSLIEATGAVRLQEAIRGESGNSWDMMACVDRMVEMGELREVTPLDTIGQHRVFVKK